MYLSALPENTLKYAPIALSLQSVNVNLSQICKIFNTKYCIVSDGLRLSGEDEVAGLDSVEHSETDYNN